jgi:hypothetical protein
MLQQRQKVLAKAEETSAGSSIEPVTSHFQRPGLTRYDAVS